MAQDKLPTKPQPDKRLISEAEKKAQDTKSKKDFFIIELYDEVNGLMGEPDVFLSEKVPDHNTGSDLLIPEEERYPVIPYPRKIKLYLKEKYPDLASVDKRVYDVRKQLEQFDYKKQGDKNEVDLENDLLDLERLRQLYVFGEKHDLISMRNGFKVLRFYKDGNIYLPLAGSLDARGFAIPGNQEIKQHTHIRTDIESEFRTKDKFSWMNATNILMIILVIGIGLTVFSAYKFHSDGKEVNKRIEEYEIKYQKLLQDYKRDVEKFGNNLVQAANLCGVPASTTPTNSGGPPTYTE